MKFVLPLIFLLILSGAYIFLFITPNSVSNYELSYGQVQAGEIYRFFTYPFVHLSLDHLLKNVISLSLITLSVIILKTHFKDFSLIYLLAGSLAILPVWFIFKFTALGSSAAIYAMFGVISLESKKYELKPFYFLALISGVILFESLLNKSSESFFSFLSHFSGVIFGLVAIKVSEKIKQRLDSKKIGVLRSIK